MKPCVHVCVYCVDRVVRPAYWAAHTHPPPHPHTHSQSMPMSPPADGKHEAPDRPRQQHAPTNGNHGDDSIHASPGSKGVSNDSMEDLHGNAVIIRIGIPDLQQTVSLRSSSSLLIKDLRRTVWVQELCQRRCTAWRCLFFSLMHN